MIGVFDSGLGGLTVVRHIRELDDRLDIHYLGDRERAPYGPRPVSEVLAFSTELTQALAEHGADPIVVACNTASAAALHPLRDAFGHLRFVGMEPAVKPAAMSTRSGVVGVVATEGTLEGPLYESVVRRFGAGTTVRAVACPEWVGFVEDGMLSGPEVERRVARDVAPLLAAGADHLVLGCTHFPLLRDAIDQAVVGRARIVDPGPAVARQVLRVADAPGAGTGRLVVQLNGHRRGLDVVLAALGLDKAVTVVGSGST